MCTVARLVVVIVCLLSSRTIYSQQLRLGKSPLALQKSAILELESDNQGLLLPRITDTTLINGLVPPDGMVIFHQPSRQMMIRSNGSWRMLADRLAGLSDVTITSPANGQVLRYNGSRWVNVSLPAYLITVDTGNITNFHVKVKSLLSAGAGINYNNTTGQISNTGVLSVNGNTGAVTVDTSLISNFHTKVKSLFSAGAGLGYNASTGRYTNSGVLSVNGNTGALTMDTGYINNFHQKVKGLFSAGTGITYNAATGMISSTVDPASAWSLNGNANTNAGTHFLGTTDDRPLLFKSFNNTYAELGSRQTLGLVQGYPDYTDGVERVFHLKSSLQFEAPGASFYKPKMYVDADGNFRMKGSSAGTDFFEFGATGTANNGGFDFIVGDDGNEPILFKSFNYQTGTTSEMMRLQNGRMAVGSSTFDGNNPEKLLVDAGVTSSFNVISGKGSIDNYLQLNIQNRSAGGTASSDLVATADNGNESTNFVDLGINSSGFTNNAYPILSGANNGYLYSTGSDFVIGNGSVNRNLRFFTGGYALTNERLRIDATGKVGIGTTTPSATLHVKTGTTDVSGVRMENLTSNSAATTGAATLGVDASGNIVRAKAPVYYSGGVGGTATVDGITKIWVAEVTNTATGTQTVNFPSNVTFNNIISITLTAKGGTDFESAPIAQIASNTNSSVTIRVVESKNTSILLVSAVEGLIAHTSTATKIYIRVEGN